MKFTLFRIDDWSDIFLVIKEDNEKLPLVVYGMLKVEGKSYEKSFVAHTSISDELQASGELPKLREQAMCRYFKKD